MSKKRHAGRPPLAPLDELGREIQQALREDQAHGAKLRWSGSRGGDLEFDGYCAVASCAYFFLQGAALAGFDPEARDIDWEAAGRAALKAGLQPMQLTLHEGWLRPTESRHWWLHTADGSVVDLTVGPRDAAGDDYPYELGRRRGFMQHGYLRPNRTRALPLIELVKQARSGR